MMLKKYYAFLFLTVAGLVLSVATAMAQPGSTGDPLPCDPDDPSCPIDTWVWVMVLGVMLSTLFYWVKQKNSPVYTTGELNN